MAIAATALAHRHEPERTSTGLNHRKLLMWAFLGSDCLFFGTFISTYMLYRGQSTGCTFRGQSIPCPTPIETFNIPYTSVSAFVLLVSSLAMVLALAAIQRGDIRSLRIWILATALLGMTFLGGQFYEFTSFFFHDHLSLYGSLFGTTFFVLTGFHGAHVTVGCIWLVSIFVLSFFGKVRQDTSLDVEIAGLYWHFVDIVWIIIFTLVYLIPV